MTDRAKPSELKPCPFCGSTDIDWNGFGGGDRPDINIDGHICRSCGAAPGEYGRVAWNRRPIEDALRAEVAALEEELHQVRMNWDSALKAEIEKHTNRGEDMNDNFSDYDAGLLNDFGGGNVGWWQDYLRAEIGRANDHWRHQVEGLTAERDRYREMFKAAKLSVCDLEAKLDKHTEPLTEEQARQALEKSGADTYHHNIMDIDAAIRRVRMGE